MTRLAVPALAAFVLAGAPAAFANAGPRIVNGTNAAIADHPFQVALWDPSRGDPNSGQFCGGVILSATKIVTAAHCLVDAGEHVGSPQGVDVLAGTADLTAGGTSVPAATLAADNRYDPGTGDHDVGLVQLSSPLWTGSPPATMSPISIVDDTTFQGYLDHLGTNPITTTVSGWGYDEPVDPTGGGPSDPGGFPSLLQSVDVPLISQTTCENDFSGSVFNTPIAGLTLFCAGDDSDSTNVNNKDSCFGDSGGPLVIDPSKNTISDTEVRLAGLVDSGFGCAWYHLPGIYTRVSDPSIVTGFINAADPSLTAAPTMGGTPQVGQTLACNPGGWTGSATFKFRFYRQTSGGPQVLTGLSASPTFSPGAALAGARVFCEVQASLGDVNRTADSASVTIAAAPPPPPSPPPPPAVDSTAPTLHVVSKSCTKTSCTVRARVTDAAPSSGIAGVKAVLRWTRRVRCMSSRASAVRTCTRRMHRTLKPKAGANGLFTIVAKRLTPGTRYRLLLTPVDNAGNKPPSATITKLRTKPRRPSG